MATAQDVPSYSEHPAPSAAAVLWRRSAPAKPRPQNLLFNVKSPQFLHKTHTEPHIYGFLQVLQFYAVVKYLKNTFSRGPCRQWLTSIGGEGLALGLRRPQTLL